MLRNGTCIETDVREGGRGRGERGGEEKCRERWREGVGREGEGEGSGEGGRGRE